MSKSALKPDLFRYDNYRRYLRDWFEWMKGSKPGYSYRVFARQTGFKAPNQLLLIINNERNVALTSLNRFFKVLQLTPQEKRYFELLVKFNQAKEMSTKADYFQELSVYWLKQGTLLESKQHAYLTQWYHTAIREMVALTSFRNSGEWISKALNRRINSKQATAAIATLLELGLLQRDGDRLVQTSQYVTTGDDAAAVAAYLYHEQMMTLALESLKKRSASERNITALTFTIRKSDYEPLVDEINDFRKRIVGWLQNRSAIDADDELYQLNIHLFPIIEKSKKDRT